MLPKFTLQYFSLSLFFLFSITINLQAQSGCPGCQVLVPNNLGADTIYLDSVPSGSISVAYAEDVSFRLPMSTTPVAANDSTISPGIGLDEITITQINNLPPGLQWETNEDIYFPGTETDGCVRLCGTPLVAGTYLLDIILEVKVLFITQETSFQREMIVYPATSINDGFTMTNNVGCGEVVVTFQNNVPSNGNTGFAYSWDFGNGNMSSTENPNTQTYDTPGTYAVDYQAVIDTAGFTLTKIRVIDADCGDFVSPADLYLDITDPNGNSMVTPEFVNVSTPVDFSLNIPMIPGNYTLVVKDEDGGLNGSDDECDFYTFNQFSNGILTNGSSSIELTILHPIDTIQTIDSIYVYPQPSQPQVIFKTPNSWCEDETIVFSSTYENGNQWLLNGNPITGATEQNWQVQESGEYAVMFTNDFGCTAVSEITDVTLFSLPELPAFDNDNNLLGVIDEEALPTDYSLQWYYENTLLQDETGLTYCLTQTGNVTLEVVDNETGCVSIFNSDETFNPEFGCGVVSTEDIAKKSLSIYPNPFNENLNIEFELNEVKDFDINVFDLLGRKIEMDQQDNFSGIYTNTFNFNGWKSGIYVLEIDLGKAKIYKRLILQN